MRVQGGFTVRADATVLKFKRFCQSHAIRVRLTVLVLTSITRGTPVCISRRQLRGAR